MGHIRICELCKYGEHANYANLDFFSVENYLYYNIKWTNLLNCCIVVIVLRTSRSYAFGSPATNGAHANNAGHTNNMKYKTYNIITIGCQMNKSDSERVAAYFEEQGMKEEEDKYKADVVVLTTCGVRQSAEDRVYGFVPRIKKENPGCFLILTGCLSERDDVKKRLKDKVDLWMPIKELPNLINLINPCKNKFGRDLYDYLDLKPRIISKVSAYVPIGNGCDNYCSYCVVPYARGREKYRQAEDIIREVKDLVDKGYKEITLIAQNVNSYSSENLNNKTQMTNKIQNPNSKQKFNFSDLLRAINDIKGEFWLRFATSHPKDMSDELIDMIANSEKICEHVHLPAQAGDNDILKAMNRKYTVEHYLDLIRKLRKKIPGVAITTDIIVGFPGETKKQFANTSKLFKEVKFDMVYIAQYSSRPGTAAAKLKDDVPKQEKKRREEALMKILRKTALKNNKEYIGKMVEVLIEGISKDGSWQGKTRTGKNVRIKNEELRIKNIEGKFVDVKIIEVSDFGMKGELV